MKQKSNAVEVGPVLLEKEAALTEAVNKRF